MVMLDSLSLLGGANLDTTRSLLVQAILTLDEAHTLQSLPSESSPLFSQPFSLNIKTALDRLSRLHILLFGPRSDEEQQDLSEWLSENRGSLQQFLGDRSNSDIDDFLTKEGASCGVLGTSKRAGADSPLVHCDILQAYQPAYRLRDELKLFRQLVERWFLKVSAETDADGKPTQAANQAFSGVPRAIVKQIAELETLYFLTRDQTTESLWNVEHQVLPVEVFLESDSGKVFRQKCQCPAVEEGKAIEHSQDVYCPKNKKDEDTPVPGSATGEAETKTEETAAVEEKTDPSEKIHSKELMAEILDMIGPQHVKDHFQKIKEAVSASYKEENPWEGKFFGLVLMGPASTEKQKIAKRYGKYLISCGIAKENRIEREASYIIENDKLEEYFRRLGDDGGVLTIENAHLLVSYKHKDKLALTYLLEQVEKKKGKITLILHGEEPELRQFLHKHKKTPLFPHVLALNEFKGDDALTILRSGMENWFGEKTEVEGGWDGLYMRIAARRIAKMKDVEVTESVGTLVKQIYQRQRKRIHETRVAKGKTSDAETADVSETTKIEKTSESDKIITSEDVPTANPVEGDRVRASKTQEHVEKSTGSDEASKTQSRVSTATTSTPATTSIVLEDSDKSKIEIDSTKLKSAEEVQMLLKQDKVEESQNEPTEEGADDDISTGQATPSSGTDTPQQKLEVEKIEPVKSIAQEVAEEPPPENSAEDKDSGKGDTEVSAATEPSYAQQKQAEDKEVAAAAEKVTVITAAKSTDGKSPAGSDLVVESTEATSLEKVAAEGSNEDKESTEDSKADAKDDSSSDESGSDSASETSEGSDATDVTTPDTKDEEEAEDPEDYLFTKDDILGPAPSNKVLESEAWKKLEKLTGLKKVKESLLNFLELAKANYQRELQEKPLLEFTFNKLFLGPPGTGKTVVAKLYGQILAEIGVLSKGDLVIKQAGDLIGKYIGDSETNTKEALKEASGGVLVLDEAYMLYTSDGVTNTTDCFRQGIIDTLVGGIQNVPGEDRCVLLLGYEDQMRNFLTESNPGLLRRFPMEEAFMFEEFSFAELKEILLGKLEEYGLEATPDAIKTAMSVLDKARARMNFGNGGAVENLITKAKSACLARIIKLPDEERPSDAWELTPVDFDPEFDRVESATSNLQKLFSDVVGCEEIIEKFEQYQLVCQATKERDMDPKEFIPTNFIFKGPPGTGKTTTARKIAQVYYDMGFLSEATVVECSVTDLIGSYIGQTGPKTAKALEKGLGKVLFIDEAYRLAEGGRSSYNHEAVSELVDCLTKPKFFGKIIVILAGYEDEMNTLLAMNPGLASRFPEEIMFDILPPAGCLEVLKKKLEDTGIEMPVMQQDEDSADRKQLERLLRSLANTPGWGNARDVETLAKNIARKVFVSGMLKKTKKDKQEKKAEAKKAEVKKPGVARARPREGEVEEKTAETEEDKKEEEKTDKEEKIEEEKPDAIKKLQCDLETATTVMQEMLTERKARSGSEPPMGMFT